MFNKKTIALIFLFAAMLVLSGCGVKENVEIMYGGRYTAENAVLEKYDTVTWESDNETVATVKNGVISTAKEPGTAVVTAIANEKVIATYHVTVGIKAITGIVLSTNAADVTEGEDLQLSYTLFPNDASDYGLEWQSADKMVAGVDQAGLVTAFQPGQTTVTVSTADGIMAAAVITVHQKAAYDRLSEKEQSFVDAMLSIINNFKNPNSVKVLAIQELGSTWYVNVSATNSYGGTVSTTYWVYENGIYKLDTTVSHDSSYDLSLINEALSDKRG